jgi:hypothetical protein
LVDNKNNNIYFQLFYIRAIYAYFKLILTVFDLVYDDTFLKKSKEQLSTFAILSLVLDDFKFSIKYLLFSFFLFLIPDQPIVFFNFCPFPSCEATLFLIYLGNRSYFNEFAFKEFDIFE